MNADDERYRGLTPGVCAGPDERLYLDVGELLAHNNIPDTPANRERVTTGARRILGELGISVETR